MLKTVVLSGFLGIVALALLVQAVPYGRDHVNPTVHNEPVWHSDQVRQLAVRACFDCHSNDTVWPWYSNIAPISWLVQRDVDEGRSVLNFSEADRMQGEGHEAAETVLEGEMPPSYYVPLHPNANLSASEKRTLADGLAAMFGSEEGRGERREGMEGDDD